MSDGALRMFPGVFPVLERKRNEVITPVVLVGDRFGRWLITGVSASKKWYFAALCDCGTQREIYQGQLIRGNSMSCGCLSRELSSERQKGKPSPMLGRQHSEEVRQLVGEQSRQRWAEGVFETPAVLAHRERLVEAQRGTPERGRNIKGPENKAAKYWRLRAPNGEVMEGLNLDHLVRGHAHLFAPKDLNFKKSRYGMDLNCNAYTQLARVGRGERPSWKGWTRA